jgi:hypothetical protein
MCIARFLNSGFQRSSDEVHLCATGRGKRDLDTRGPGPTFFRTIGERLGKRLKIALSRFILALVTTLCDIGEQKLTCKACTRWQIHITTDGTLNSKLYLFLISSPLKTEA